MIKYFSLVLVLGLLFSTEAQASSNRVLKAQALAVKMWGPINNGQVTVDRGPVPPGAYAMASQDGTYRITYKEGQKFSWGSFCTLMLHEYGHLAGYRPPAKFADPADPLHSTNPFSIMYPTYWRVHPWCRK